MMSVCACRGSGVEWGREGGDWASHADNFSLVRCHERQGCVHTAQDEFSTG